MHGARTDVGGGPGPGPEIGFPGRARIAHICTRLLGLLFPGYFEFDPGWLDGADPLESRSAHSVRDDLFLEVSRAFRAPADPGASEDEAPGRAERAVARLFHAFPAVRELLAEDVGAAYDGDPAAKSHLEVVLAYPCVVALSIYRLAHILHIEGVPLVPRMMTEHAHSRTGIDIHPGARIGRRFFIDHGTGVVIGETTEIGDDVKLYQGVTLGARSFPKDETGGLVRGLKRHPTIEDGVVVYSGATILGDVVIGAGSVIGGSVWLTHSIPPLTTVLVSVAQEIRLQAGSDDYRI